MYRPARYVRPLRATGSQPSPPARAFPAWLPEVMAPASGSLPSEMTMEALCAGSWSALLAGIVAAPSGGHLPDAGYEAVLQWLTSLGSLEP
ncbi:hypothetical protein H696_06379, partial [Fonticula alba]